MVADLVANAAIVVMAWSFARIVRTSTDQRVATEVAHDRSVREAVAAERDRIAHDLHDSVAHALTVMTLQAGAARERTQEPVVADALRCIEAGGREALVDMHRFLQLIGDDSDRPRESPGLRDLDDMVDRLRSGGMDVALTVTGDVMEVPASVSSTAYRVVQEGLTNAVKHSGARRADVNVRIDADEIVIDVADAGAATPSQRQFAVGSGRGLAGLRERVSLFGGLVTAGVDGASGWRLRAVIPVGQS